MARAPSVSFACIGKREIWPPWCAPSWMRRARKWSGRRERTEFSDAMIKIGLLCGREYSFPPAFLERVNRIGAMHGIVAEFVKLGGTKMGEPSGYRVIVDRISHAVEYYGAFLKHAALEATY